MVQGSIPTYPMNDILVFSNEESSSIYTANKGRDNVPPCRTPLKIVKYENFSIPHPMRNSCLMYKNIIILTTKMLLLINMHGYNQRL